MSLLSSLKPGAATGMPCSRKSLRSHCSECKAVTKALTSRKSSLINRTLALVALLPFLVSPHPLLPHFLPGPSSSVPTFSLACPHSVLLLLGYGYAYLLLGFSSFLPSPFLFLSSPCFFIPPVPPEPFNLCHRVGEAGLVASPSAASPKRHHVELPAVLSHFALLWPGFAQMNRRPQLGGLGHRDLVCHLPAQPSHPLEISRCLAQVTKIKEIGEKGRYRQAQWYRVRLYTNLLTSYSELG